MPARLRPLPLLAGLAAGAILTGCAVAAHRVHGVAWQMWATRLHVATPGARFLFAASVATVFVVVAIVANSRRREHASARTWAVASGIVVAVALVAGSEPGHPIAPPPAATTAATVTPNMAAADGRALSELMSYYDPRTGRWVIGTTGWWSGAVALSALIGAQRALGVHTYDRDIAHTWAVNRDFEGPDFRNAYFDDTLWWGLAWLDAWEYTHDPRYLRTAELDEQYAAMAWTPSCGGGVTWASSVVHNGGQKNSITNELLIALAGRLAVDTGRPDYLATAQRTWSWLAASGMVRRDGLVADHLDGRCRAVGAPLTYTQGVVLTGLSALADATRDPRYVAHARRLADASTTSPWLVRGGVLREPCYPDCGVDGATFAGAYVHALGQLNAQFADHPYSAFLARNATSAYCHDRAAGDEYGSWWAGPLDATNSARQATAVDLLTAAAEAQNT